MITLINVGVVYLSYEIIVGLQVIRNQLFKTGKKWGYVPPSVMFAKDHEKYVEWNEWKGDRFK